MQPIEKKVFNLKSPKENSQCSLEITPSSTIITKQDNLQNFFIEIGKGDKTVIKYEFERKGPPNTTDGQHTELIYFEIDNNCKSLSLINEELQEVKMMYGRLCYCKGTSGYFKVTQGDLKFTNENNELSINLKFKVGKIPQLITEINETIKLDVNKEQSH